MPDNQRRLMRLLPIGVVFFVWQFPVPAGLVLYWMTTNLWTAGQQLVMRHRIGLHLADPEEVAKFNATNQPKKGSRTAPQGEDDDEDVAVEAARDARHAAQAPSRGRGGRGRGGRGRAPRPRRRGAEAEPSAEPDPSPSPRRPTEAAEAPDAEPAPEPAAAKPARKGSNGSGAQRRQPRPKGVAKGSRPAGSSRSKKKKR